MTAPGSDGHPQMHIGTPSQMQHPQVQQQIHVQMVGQHQVIHHRMPLQGANVRMQAVDIHQMAKPGGIITDQPIPTFMNGTNRVIGAGPMPQQVHVISQGMFQQQSPQTAYITSDGGHSIHTSVVEAQQRPVVTSYGQGGNVHLQTVYQVPNQMRRRPGVQQPMYTTGIRVAQPIPNSGGGSQVRFIQNSNGPSMMQLVTQQGSNQIPVSQAHFIPQEAQQQQQQQQSSPQRIVVSQRPMMVFQSPQQQQQQQQQLQGQQGRSAMMIQQHQARPSEPVTAALTPEQRQQHFRNLITQYIQILGKKMVEVQSQTPSIDITHYQKLRQYLERIRESNEPPPLSRIENVMRQIENNPFLVLTQRSAAATAGSGAAAAASSQQQQQQNHQAAAVAASEETRQKLLAQKRLIASSTQHGQRVSMTAVRPGMMGASSSSGLNSLLSQPVDVVPGGVPQTSRQQPPSQPTRIMPTALQHAQHASTQQQQQQQQPFVDPFIADMDKLMEEFTKLEEKVGKERFNRARAEISDETRDLRLQTGYLLPRDLFPSPSTPPLCPPSPDVKLSPAVADAETSSSRGSRKRTISGTGSLETHDPPKRVKLEGDKAAVNPDNDQCSNKKEEEDESFKTKDTLEAASSVALATADKLFVDGTTPSDPGFSESSLNPKLRAEINRLRSKLYEVTLTVVTYGNDDSSGAPGMEEMESHMTCLDVAEWRSSLVVKLIFEHKLMPWDVPPLFVRLSPKYLASGVDQERQRRVKWYIRESDFKTPSIPQDGKIHIFTRSEIVLFLELCRQLIGQFLDPLCTVAGAERLGVMALDLSYIAEVWVKCLLMAVNEFVGA